LKDNVGDNEGETTMKSITKLTLEEINEAIALYLHLLNHEEVQTAPTHTGEPMCRICGRTAREVVKYNL
jgi:phosphoribosylformylglycinamidine (FGAM) synthase PurS component